MTGRHRERADEVRTGWAYVRQFRARGRTVTEAFHDARDGGAPVLRDDFGGVDEALRWACDRAERVTLRVPGRTMYSAGVIAVAGLPEWPPRLDVRKAIDAERALLERPWGPGPPHGPPDDVALAYYRSQSEFPDPLPAATPRTHPRRRISTASIIEHPGQQPVYSASWNAAPDGETTDTEEGIGPLGVLADALAWARDRSPRVRLYIRSRGLYSAGVEGLARLPEWPPAPKVMAAIARERALLRRLDADDAPPEGRRALRRQLDRSVALRPDRLPGGGFVVPGW